MRHGLATFSCSNSGFALRDAEIEARGSKIALGEELVALIMSAGGETSDCSILDLLREQGPQGVTELASSTGVTLTAVRQRLVRLMSRGLIERQTQRAGRGRPSHRYSLTAKGLKQAGNNYADLAQVLWSEVRAIKDPEVRQGLLGRLASRLADLYGKQVQGDTLLERMESLSQLLAERDIPFKVDRTQELPVLTALACPYPELAQRDHSVCAMERTLLSEVLGQGLKLTECRLSGARCCTFEVN